MKKIKLLFFSRLSTIFLLALFFLINSVSFMAEYLFGGVSLSIEKWVRLLSIVSDFVVVGFGILSWFQITFRRSYRMRLFFESKPLIWIAFFADVLAAFCVVYSFYVFRLFIFWITGAITYESLFYNTLLGLIGVFLFGFVNIFVRRTKKYLRNLSNVKK